MSIQPNCTLVNELLDQIISLKLNGTMASESGREKIGDPGTYIIAVLLFYSFGIVILMINYMTKSTNESEDYYLKYLEQLRMRQAENYNRSRGLNKLALQAFNAVNVIQTNEKVTFV